MELDIRTEKITEVRVIRVADVSSSWLIVDTLENDGRKGHVKLTDSDEGSCLDVTDKQHALDLIKGLEKAIELGWLK